MAEGRGQAPQAPWHAAAARLRGGVQRSQQCRRAVQPQDGDRQAMHVEGGHEPPAVEPLHAHAQLAACKPRGGPGSHIHLQGCGAAEVVDQQRHRLACGRQQGKPTGRGWRQALQLAGHCAMQGSHELSRGGRSTCCPRTLANWEVGIGLAGDAHQQLIHDARHGPAGGSGSKGALG